jgi:drug/metabolite transporter (DMT)-like permease
MKVSQNKNSVLIATLWMMGTLFSFMGMAIGGRELSRELPTFQILFFRSLIGLMIVLPILFAGGWNRVITKHFLEHTIRNLAHLGGQFGWFYGIAYISLANVFAIEFTLPVWTAILASFMLKEKLTRPRVAAIIFGLMGMLVILRPGLGVMNPVALIVLASAVCYAFSHTLTRKLAMHDPPIVILFYMTMIQLPIALILSLDKWTNPSMNLWPWLLVVGITALSAHYCMARAFQIAEATVVVPMDFLRLPLIAVVGYIAYNEAIDWYVLFGAFVMLIGNFINIQAERQKNES